MEMKTVGDREIKVGHSVINRFNEVYLQIINSQGDSITACLTEEETEKLIKMLQESLEFAREGKGFGKVKIDAVVMG